MLENPITELEGLAIYVEGMADATQNEKLKRAADWLSKASDHICAQGYFGCEGGRECGSDHK